MTTLLASYLKELSGLTKRAYYSDLQQFALWCWDDHFYLTAQYQKTNVTLTDLPDELWLSIDLDDIIAYLTYMKEGIKFKPATIARRLIALTKFLEYAKKDSEYPGEKYEKIKDFSRKHKKGYETDHHSNVPGALQNRLLETAASRPGLKGKRDYLIILLLLETGLRRFELVNLQIGDLAIRDDQPSIFVAAAKKQKARTIGLKRRTYNLIKQWLDESGQNQDPIYPIFCKVRKKGKKEEACYTAVNSEIPLNPATINRLVSGLVLEAGIEIDEGEKITPHSFRVATITDAVEGDAPLLHIQAVAGHSDGRMIKEIYNRHKHKAPLADYRKHQLYEPES